MQSTGSHAPEGQRGGFLPDEDAEALRGYVRSFLEKESPTSRVRELMCATTGYDQAFWRRSGQELGLQGLAIASEQGGAAAGLVHLGVVFEELGRALVCAPFLSTVGLAATALAQVPGEVAAEHQAAIAAGAETATLAWSGETPATSGLRFTDGVVNGVAPVVIDGCDADLILVAARTDDGCGLFAIPTDAVGPERAPLVPLDSTRRLAQLTFTDTPVDVLVEHAEELLERTMNVALLLLAAEQLGGARKVLEMAVSYARTRVQFGRYIGSFQAVKHKCADMLVDVELATSVVYHGLFAADEDAATLPVEAPLARSVVSDAYLHAAAENVQIHGGIGFTWEHDAHLYLKRAKSSALLFGTAGAHRRRLAIALNIGGAR